MRFIDKPFQNHLRRKSIDENILKDVRSKGGRVQGKINAESGHLKRISQGRTWITNGIINRFYLKSDILLNGLPDGFNYGRKNNNANL